MGVLTPLPTRALFTDSDHNAQTIIGIFLI